MAGMAAALFAAERGLSCIQVGNGGGLLFASGLLDLLGVHPVAARRRWRSPYEALAALAHDEPEHPLARVDAASIRTAFETFVAALGAGGPALRPAGRSQPGGADVDRNDQDHLRRAAIDGRAASTRWTRGRRACWWTSAACASSAPARSSRRWALAGRGCATSASSSRGATAAPELYAAHLARALESRATRERTIALVRPLLGDAQAVGFPAVLGLAQRREVHAAFEARLGVPVFEIPTMPTSVPGLRLLAALEAAVADRGVHRRHQARVRALAFDARGTTATLDLAGDSEAKPAMANASSRARSCWRRADSAAAGSSPIARGVRESILGLPVFQPGSREAWHRRDFLDPSGHAINRAGLERRRRVATAGRQREPGVAAALRRRLHSRASGLDALQVRLGVGDRDGVGGESTRWRASSAAPGTR